VVEEKEHEERVLEAIQKAGEEALKEEWVDSMAGTVGQVEEPEERK
jgi:hypothetical protein